MKFRPLSISQKGLEKHLEDKGVSYKRVLEYFDNGATNKFIAQKTTKDEHTVARWRKAYNSEQKRAVVEAALDELKDV